MKTINFEQLLDNISTAVLLLDENTQIQYANLSAEALFEHSRNQLTGHSIAEFLIGNTLNLERLRSALNNRDNFTDTEQQLIFKDGRHCLATIVVSFYESNENAVLALEISPVDQQRRISKENQQWALQQASRDLIRGLAHEIKNPLGGIRGAAQLLERELVESSLKDFTRLIVEQSDRLRNLVDRLLGPNKKPKFEWRNVHRVMEKVRTLLTLEHTQLFLERDYDPSIPDLHIDQDMMEQAILNIARNAVQATKGKGKIRFVTRVQRQLVIHGKRFPLCAEIKIIDNGPGIPEEIHDTLFYPMVTSKVDGSGLGLSISQSVINHHQGKIQVESWPGHTEFTILLPVDKKEEVK